MIHDGVALIVYWKMMFKTVLKEPVLFTRDLFQCVIYVLLLSVIYYHVFMLIIVFNFFCEKSFTINHLSKLARYAGTLGIS